MTEPCESGAALRVSVLMPVYNTERYVAEAVRSILAQTYDELEVLIYDDGSTDRSPEILHGLAERDPRIRLFLRPHTGLTTWLRAGVEIARGEYVARMDADDIAHPERLAAQLSYLDAHPECVVVGTEARLVDPERRPIKQLGVQLTHDGIDADLMRGRGDAMLHPASTFRRDAILAVGSYRVDFEAAEILDLNLRLAERGRVANLPDTLLEYRQHLDKVSARRKGDQRRAQDAALREAIERRGLDESHLPRRRPVPEAIPRTDQWHRWAAWAIEAGHLATARRHAWAVFREEPRSRRACKLLLRALLGMRLATARRIAGLFGVSPAGELPAAQPSIRP